eukprot:CAMPEP_0114341946 /NCGR_PEP_ID=MMETSP0101-20121206/9411_1 /TAXON_ID=38822 ORGANISM="Pteridomonas danica, Strain PT" /NCGR_SAMPLE_ID=MMETSP0101 /ASSEMBLY_ACC=CAM_ASM_000211 /LENGTH=419 /DNA_ID=CAMNT_0001475769 /DNA_START=848 /DNA_END=2107 /DNA_ORIENTATION=+
MQAISLAAHSLSEDGSDVQGDVETIISSSAVLETIMSNILEFKTISSMKLVPIPNPINVKENLNRIVNMLKHSTLVNEDVILHSVCDQSAATSLSIDSQMLDRIVLNLVTNALKFTLKGSVSVVYSLEDRSSNLMNEESLDRDVKQNIIDQPKMLKIEVIDSGCGMDEKSQAHVGELDFFSGEAGGFGLGTFIVRTYIQALQGSLDVTSQVGVGTTITVKIPTKIAPVKQTVPSKKRNSHSSRGPVSRTIEYTPCKGKVLVVEDIQVNRKLIVRSLERGGFEVDQAENGAIALRLMLENTYQTVFMDINMPVMNGDIAVREYWKQCDPKMVEHPRIIMLTGNITDADREMALACGAHEFLTKPVLPKQLWDAAKLQPVSKCTSEEFDFTDEEPSEEGSPKLRQRISYDDSFPTSLEPRK